MTASSMQPRGFEQKTSDPISNDGDKVLYAYMKTIEVVAAIIIRDGQVFTTQRGYGQWQGWWEFPGGKMEDGESPKEALVREIREELDADISVGELLETVEWDYPDFHLTMHCFICRLASQEIHLNEHEDAAWLTAETLDSVKWLPADEGVIARIKKEGLTDL